MALWAESDLLVALLPGIPQWPTAHDIICNAAKVMQEAAQMIEAWRTEALAWARADATEDGVMSAQIEQFVQERLIQHSMGG